MATAVPMGAPAPDTLAQAADEVVPAGYHRPYIGAGLEPIKDPATLAPPGTPVCGPTDGPFEAGKVPLGASAPLTAEQAAYLNKKYGVTP
jgi:hypothetical protein